MSDTPTQAQATHVSTEDRLQRLLLVERSGRLQATRAALEAQLALAARDLQEVTAGLEAHRAAFAVRYGMGPRDTFHPETGAITRA